jgi:YVTN family beta-propeller protein
MAASATSGTFVVALRQTPKLVSVLAITLLAIAAKPAQNQSGALVKERYLSPIEMAVSPDGHQLYVVCQDSDEVRVVDPESARVIGSIHVGRMPRGIVLSPDARRLYVTNAWSDTVSVIDTASHEVVQTLSTGFEPAGVVVDKPGTTLYVANRLSSDISVIDPATGQEIKRLLAGRGASYLTVSPDGKCRNRRSQSSILPRAEWLSASLSTMSQVYFM